MMIARVFVERLVAGDLDAVTVSMAKWKYPISQMFVDARIQKIYGGTNEVMKLLIARSL